MKPLKQIEKILKLKSELDRYLAECHMRLEEIGNEIGILYAGVREERTCKWKWNEYHCWNTACGAIMGCAFKNKFCPNCGGKIEEVK